jgi:hypothetical protein
VPVKCGAVPFIASATGDAGGRVAAYRLIDTALQYWIFLYMEPLAIKTRGEKDFPWACTRGLENQSAVGG